LRVTKQNKKEWIVRTKPEKNPRSFETTARANVPLGRNGKHKTIVTRILNSLEALEPGKSLKIPLSELPDNKTNIRSALNRATRKLQRSVATASDDDFLYVWNS
jgi:hypothetical protein